MPYINKSLTDNWGTPKNLYENLNDEFDFDFDPCPYRNDFDGLKIDWKKRNFVNPPYSNIKDWAKKCRDEQKKGNLSVLLIPPRTDTKYFHEYIYKYAELRFIKGRLKFQNLEKPKEKPKPAPIPSMLCIFRGF